MPGKMCLCACEGVCLCLCMCVCVFVCEGVMVEVARQTETTVFLTLVGRTKQVGVRAAETDHVCVCVCIWLQGRHAVRPDEVWPVALLPIRVGPLQCDS